MKRIGWLFIRGARALPITRRTGRVGELNRLKNDRLISAPALDVAE
jgi:hypothetical protein